MQSLTLSLSPTNQTMNINNEASGIWYESGVSAINTRIIISPEVGGEIELKPGQRVKMTQMQKSWRIRSLDPAATITGKILIGSGEFEDNSSLVTLDASFANNVTVMNASVPVTVSGGDVEIKNDAGNPIPTTITNTPSVTISGTAQVQENLIAATATSAHINKTQGYVHSIVTAAQNTNGIIIHSAGGVFMAPNAVGVVGVLVKNGSNPATIDDGTPIAIGVASANGITQFSLPTKVRIPAGYSLSCVNSLAGATFASVNVGVTYTLL